MSIAQVEKATVVDLVKDHFGFEKDSELASFCKVDRSCVWEWRNRLHGGIPTRHWTYLIDESRRQRREKRDGKPLTFEELRGL